MIKTCWDCKFFNETETEEQCFGNIPDEHDFNGMKTCRAFAWLDPRLAALERAEEYLHGVFENRHGNAEIIINTLNIIEGKMK